MPLSLAWLSIGCKSFSVPWCQQAVCEEADTVLKATSRQVSAQTWFSQTLVQGSSVKDIFPYQEKLLAYTALLLAAWE